LPLDIELPPAPVKDEIFDLLLDACLTKICPLEITAIIEVTEDGHGFLLQEKDNYRLKSQSPFVPAPLIKRFGLKTGHSVQGFIHSKLEGSTCPILVQIDKIMDADPEEASRIMPFTELVPYYPLERIFLETSADAEWDNVSMRVVDLVSPIGFGQRGLIVAPPRTGKTVLQQAIARALRVNNPQAHLIVLLVDERPEEVTDFRRQVPDSEVIASTFDESAESHVHAAEIVIEKARRMVECNQDVVILLDSITRLARAYNTTMPSSGKILSGGVEATALQRPKRFFGSARNIEGGGSLTILGTALVETGSKMDEVIFEEFKGTGNMELHLDRELSNKRIFPALDFEKSGTRKEELLYHPDELNKIYSLRRSLKGVPPVEAMEMFIQRVRKTKNNPEFLVGLGR
jgi:transcription termination factor Rho